MAWVLAMPKEISERACGASGRLRIVQIDHADIRPRQKIAKQRAQFLQTLVVQADIVQHRDAGAVERDRAVAFIHFGYKDPTLTDPRAGKGCIGARKFFITAPFMIVGHGPARS
jgi:hypothetical protein